MATRKKEVGYNKGYEGRVSLENEEPKKSFKKSSESHACEFKNEKDCEEELEEEGESTEEVDLDEE